MWSVRSLALALFLFGAGLAHGQGCAMCSTGADAAGAKQKAALTRGVFVLLAPALVLLGGLGVAGYRMRNRTGAPPEGASRAASGDPPDV